jgi:hypothetical protein
VRVNQTVFLCTVLLLVLAVGLLRITPKVWPWDWQSKLPIAYEVNRVRPLLNQLDDPANWDRSIALSPDVGVGNALRWRLLPPVVGGALHLSHQQYLYVPWIGWVMLVGSVLYYSKRRILLDWSQVFALGILTVLSSPGYWGIWVVGSFSAWWLWLLVVTVFSGSGAISTGVCVLGPWIDERFVLILPAALLLRWSLDPGSRERRGWYAVAVAPYLLIRGIAVLRGDGAVATQLVIQSEFWPGYWLDVLCGWWQAYRAGWLIILSGLWLVFSAPNSIYRQKVLLGAVLLGYYAAISWLAWDSTSNAAALIPFLIAGSRHPLAKKWVWVLAALNLILPAAIWSGDLRVPLTSYFNR